MRRLDKFAWRRAYAKYLRSKKWQRIRDLVIARDNGECQKCGSKQRLQVHHLNYKSVFQEEKDLGALVTLCSRCHRKIHRRRRKRNGKNRTKRRVGKRK